MKLRWPLRRSPPERELTYTEKVLLERLRARVTPHQCPICNVWHGGPGA